MSPAVPRPAEGIHSHNNSSGESGGKGESKSRGSGPKLGKTMKQTSSIPAESSCPDCNNLVNFNRQCILCLAAKSPVLQRTIKRPSSSNHSKHGLSSPQNSSPRDISSFRSQRWSPSKGPGQSSYRAASKGRQQSPTRSCRSSNRSSSPTSFSNHNPSSQRGRCSSPYKPTGPQNRSSSKHRPPSKGASQHENCSMSNRRSTPVRRPLPQRKQSRSEAHGQIVDRSFILPAKTMKQMFPQTMIPDRHCPMCTVLINDSLSRRWSEFMLLHHPGLYYVCPGSSPLQLPLTVEFGLYYLPYQAATNPTFRLGASPTETAFWLDLHSLLSPPFDHSVGLAWQAAQQFVIFWADAPHHANSDGH